MFKFMKYEIKSQYKVILSLLILCIILNGLLLLKYDNWPSELIFGLTILIAFGANLTALIYIIHCYNGDLYEDRGYLTFTLPLNGNKILTSKIILAMLWFIIISLISGVFVIMAFHNMDVPQQISEFNNIFINFKYISFLIVAGLLSTLSLLIIIYHSITLTRVTLKGRRIGKFLAVIVFQLNSFGITYLHVKIAEHLPYNIVVNLIDNSYSNSNELNVNIADGFLINIPGMIFSMLVIVGLYLTTSYYIDKKIDLQ